MEDRNFRLTHDIHNLDHDGRCKRGLRSMKVFKAGSMVRATLHSYDYDEVTVAYTTYSLACDGGGFEQVDNRGSVHEEIVRQDPGVDMPIQTLEDAASRVHMEVTEFCRYVVRQLIKEGRLDPAETKELYEKTEEGDW